MRAPSKGGFEANAASFVPLAGLPCSCPTRRKVPPVTPSSHNRRRTEPVRDLLVVQQALDAETPDMSAREDQAEGARPGSGRAEDLAAVMALMPGVRVVMLT